MAKKIKAKTPVFPPVKKVALSPNGLAEVTVPAGYTPLVAVDPEKGVVRVTTVLNQFGFRRLRG